MAKNKSIAFAAFLCHFSFSLFSIFSAVSIKRMHFEQIIDQCTKWWLTKWFSVWRNLTHESQIRKLLWYPEMLTDDTLSVKFTHISSKAKTTTWQDTHTQQVHALWGIRTQIFTSRRFSSVGFCVHVNRFSLKRHETTDNEENVKEKYEERSVNTTIA